jgi:hypothetical protein
MMLSSSSSHASRCSSGAALLLLLAAAMLLVIAAAAPLGAQANTITTKTTSATTMLTAATATQRVPLIANEHDDKGSGNGSCSSCLTVLNVLVALAETPEPTLKVIVALLQQNVCDKVFAGAANATMRAICEQATELVLLKVLPWAKDNLDDLAWPIPTAICALLNKCEVNCCKTRGQPEQLHLSLPTEGPRGMVVTWVTLDKPTRPVVQYTLASNANVSATALGTSWTYTFAGWQGWISSAVMSPLRPNSRYTYRVGDAASQVWSERITFKTMQSMPTAGAPLRIAHLADFGFGNASDNTRDRLAELVKADALDVILAGGDISYADGYQPHWDLQFRKFEGLYSRVPMQAALGNHEFWANFSAITARHATSIGGIVQPMKWWYHVNVGNALFMGLNTETWIDTADYGAQQRAYIKTTLAEANAQGNQSFIVVFQHRPLYCTNGNKMNCQTFASILRDQAEELFYNGNVDLVIQGHQHDFEASTPLYKGERMPDGAAPVYIIDGGAGNREHLTGGFIEPPPAFVAGRFKEYSFSVISLYANATMVSRLHSTEPGFKLLFETHIAAKQH